ncbi:DUF721 domain-containing protein [Sphingomonas sp. ASV193]|uniref:DUF721 domain-containing protein n=1 Tax=Sphingomonas sp. ASV193 TaxID=3144405 RepID=UPI0032E8BD71
MTKPRAPKSTPAAAERHGKVRSAGELVGAVGGVAFRRFGFVQSAVVERWAEIVGERYARVSLPESIRFPAGKKAGGALTLTVEGAHAPLMQHMAPMIVERVNRFFGYQAVDRIVFRQGRIAPAPKPARPAAPSRPVPADTAANIRAVDDPELRAVLESLAGKLAGSSGPPVADEPRPVTIPLIRLADG